MYELSYGDEVKTSNDYAALRKFADTLKCHWTITSASGWIMAAFRGVM